MSEQPNLKPTRNDANQPCPRLNELLGMDYGHYSVAPGINQSGLAQVLRSPSHYQQYLVGENKETPAMVLGRAAHLSIFEPEKYKFIARVKKNKKEASTHRAALDIDTSQLADLALPLSQAQDEQCKAMRRAVWANPDARRLLSKGKAEQSMWWQDPHHGVLCKARFDFISTAGNRPVCVDLKTTLDASLTSFAKSFVNYRYDMQAAHYLAAGKVSGQFCADDFFFIVVEKNPPYATCVYSLSDHAYTLGFKWREEAMSIYAEAYKSNIWRSLPTADELVLPKWAKVPGEDEEAML